MRLRIGQWAIRLRRVTGAVRIGIAIAIGIGIVIGIDIDIGIGIVIGIGIHIAIGRIDIRQLRLRLAATLWW